MTLQSTTIIRIIRFPKAKNILHLYICWIFLFPTVKFLFSAHAFHDGHLRSRTTKIPLVHLKTFKNYSVDATSRCCKSLLLASNNDKDTICDERKLHQFAVLREHFLRTSMYAICNIAFGNLLTYEARAFDGGVGGLGKSKPETGVFFFESDTAEQLHDQDSNGVVSAELVTLSKDNKKPVLVSFQSPWPLFSSGGIECRDLRNPESAFVQVAEAPSNGKLGKDFLIQSVFASSGKFGAYGTPFDVKVKNVSKPDSENERSSSNVYSVSFTTLTPGMRESERRGFITTSSIDQTVFMLVTTTLSTRWKAQEPIIRSVAESFRATPAPQTSFRK